MSNRASQRKLLLVAAGAMAIAAIADAATGDWMGVLSSLMLLTAVLMLAWGVPERSQGGRIVFYVAIATVFVIVTLQLFQA